MQQKKNLLFLTKHKKNCLTLIAKKNVFFRGGRTKSMQPTNALAPSPPPPPRYLMVRPLSYLIVRKQTEVITLFYLFPITLLDLNEASFNTNGQHIF